MVILDQLNLPPGLSLGEAAALAHAAGEVGEGELLVLIERVGPDAEEVNSPAPDQPTTALGRIESAPTPADEPSATPRATLDLTDPAVQSALGYLRALKPPLTYAFDANTCEYVVRTVGNEFAAPVELFRNKDPRVLADRARNIKGPPA